MIRPRANFKRIFFTLAAVFGVVALLGVTSTAWAESSNVATSSGVKTRLSGRFYAPRYVALGDSVAAGLGLSVAPDATDEDKVCGRSPFAYSSGVSDGINAALSNFNFRLSSSNAACQGAVVDNLSQSQTRGTATIQPQLDKAFAQGTPALLTLTMGANDAHWAEFIGACFSAANCNTQANTDLANAYLAAMQTKLSAALNDIKSRSRFLPPIVVVTGYYNPISERCANPNLTVDEIAWLTQETEAFNASLRTATQQAGWFARFAPIDFTGHDICSADSWIQRPGVPGELAPFHPTVRGQQAMSEAVLRSLGL